MDASSIASLGGDPHQLKEMAINKHFKAAATKEVTTQFESLLLRQYLKDALKPVFGGGFLEETGGAHDMYRYFFTDAIAEGVARGGGFGLADVLQQQIMQLSENGND
jgi:Rod binding domain-containing protein